MDPFDSFVVFSIKHGMGNVNDLHELQTRSVFRGRTASLAPTADAWRLFAPTAGTQCLSRLRRAHSAFRAYGVPYKRKLQGICLPLHTGKALQKQANRFTKARKEEIHRSHTTSGKQQRKTQKDPALGNLPGLGPCSLSGRSLPFYFDVQSTITQSLPCSAL